jgi:hypothetical protein
MRLWIMQVKIIPGINIMYIRIYFKMDIYKITAWRFLLVHNTV